MGGHCRLCPRRTDCLPESAKSRARFVYRSPHQHEIDKVRARQETKAFISKMILRKWTIVGLFAEAKQFHGLRRARYRGLQKVSIQSLMTAMAQEHQASESLNNYLMFVGLLEDIRISEKK